jgi:hypothetical protein
MPRAAERAGKRSVSTPVDGGVSASEDEPARSGVTGSAGVAFS